MRTARWSPEAKRVNVDLMGLERAAVRHDRNMHTVVTVQASKEPTVLQDQEMRLN